MPPAEVDALAERICADIAMEGHAPEAQAETLRLVMMVKGFCAEWRQLWALFGDQPEGWPQYLELRRQVRSHLQQYRIPVFLRSNGALLKEALQDGLMRQVIPAPLASENEAAARRVRIERPTFIVSAPRSGSTLLFETLAQSASLCTLGGEAHELVEQFAALQPGGGVDSNRLVAADLTPDIAQTMKETLYRQLRRADGQRPAEGEVVRVLEKTPKNALRIPFLKAWFPDAKFIFLWREPAANVSSIMEAWRSGKFETYRALDFDKPWSLLLPPGWRELRGKPLEDVAAFQWRTTNETLLEDLAALPAADWTSISYADFTAHTEREVRRLCEFIGIPFDEALRARVSQPLPQARHTLTTPDAQKWRRNEAELRNVLPGLAPVTSRLASLAR